MISNDQNDNSEGGQMLGEPSKAPKKRTRKIKTINLKNKKTGR